MAALFVVACSSAPSSTQDTGVPERDAGSVGEDTGAPPEDAGAPADDAASADDAATMDDAGASGDDAGATCPNIAGNYAWTSTGSGCNPMGSATIDQTGCTVTVTGIYAGPVDYLLNAAGASESCATGANNCLRAMGTTVTIMDDPCSFMLTRR